MDKKSVMTVEETAMIAIKAHNGQKDKDGNPVILHPFFVATQGDNEIEVKAGLLHDVIEDTSITAEDLIKMGVEKEVVDVLRLLTHNKDEMSYDEYIERIVKSGNLYALKVKRNDLRHNIHRGKKSGFFDLVEKHEKALDKIMAALDKF